MVDKFAMIKLKELYLPDETMPQLRFDAWITCSWRPMLSGHVNAPPAQASTLRNNPIFHIL